MPGSRQILIAGVGNLLLSDDGVGVHALRQLERDPLPGVRLAEIGTAILHGLHFLEGVERVLVIDAARGGKPPGTLYLFDASERREPGSMNSIHAMGLHEAARFLLAGQAAPPFTVLGVEPQTLAYGMQLSGPVQGVLTKVVALARQIAADWLRSPPAETRFARPPGRKSSAISDHANNTLL